MKRRFSISNVKLNIFAIHSSHSICLRHSIQFQICVRISFIWTLWSTIPIICTSGSRNDHSLFYFNVSIFRSHTGQTNIYIDVWIIKFVQSCNFFFWILPLLPCDQLFYILNVSNSIKIITICASSTKALQLNHNSFTIVEMKRCFVITNCTC